MREICELENGTRRLWMARLLNEEEVDRVQWFIEEMRRAEWERRGWRGYDTSVAISLRYPYA